MPCLRRWLWQHSRPCVPSSRLPRNAVRELIAAVTLLLRYDEVRSRPTGEKLVALHDALVEAAKVREGSSSLRLGGGSPTWGRHSLTRKRSSVQRVCVSGGGEGCVQAM